MRRLGELGALRQKKREAGGAAATLRMAASEADLSGKLVAVAEHVTKAFGAKTVVRDLTMRVQRGDRLGIIGPNGAGKTTLLNLLTGKDDGGWRRGPRGHEPARGDAGPAARGAGPGNATLADTLTGGRGRPGRGGRREAARDRLHEGLPVQARAGADAGGGAERRGAGAAAAGLRAGAAKQL